MLKAGVICAAASGQATSYDRVSRCNYKDLVAVFGLLRHIVSPAFGG